MKIVKYTIMHQNYIYTVFLNNLLKAEHINQNKASFTGVQPAVSLGSMLGLMAHSHFEILSNF